MNIDFSKITELTEGFDFEAKKAQGKSGEGKLPDDFFETYSAMANTEGGVVVLGLEEQASGKWNVLGIANPDKVVKELWDLLNNRKRVSHNLLSELDVRRIEIGQKKLVTITIPRATRSQIPVYLGANPFTGTYRRRGEGDYLCDQETVKRMLADQVEDARDGKLLEHFTFQDLNQATLRAYRTAFKAVKPDHPWVELENSEFLRNIGGWTINREAGREGLTAAGLLMFGKLRSILDAFPYYIVDYQERPPDAKQDMDRRWTDRVTTDGSWSGNLYDFYRMVILRLTYDLKVPFRIQNGTRIDDTPVHEAVREALVNLIIHADFTGRVSLYVVKRQDMFGFRNPGLMRVPLPAAIRGGTSDCRNRNLQKMFQLVGLAEQAGSGLPKVFHNWSKQHWRLPELMEQHEPEQTILRLRMVSLLPQKILTELDARFGLRYRSLPEVARMALATVAIEGSVTHGRLKEMRPEHPKDLTETLSTLVENKFLVSRGAGRGTVYYFQDKAPDSSSDGMVAEICNSQHLPPGSQHLPQDSQLLSPDLQQWATLMDLARPIRDTGKAPRTSVESTITAVCSGRYLTVRNLAELLGRDTDALLNHYLKDMVVAGILKLRFPDKPNHPQQAYTADLNPKISNAPDARHQ